MVYYLTEHIGKFRNIDLKIKKVFMNNYNLLKNDENSVLISDTGIGKSITNSAEDVVKELTNRNDEFCIVNKHLYYIDTDGCTDELLHDNKGNFIGFNLLNL